MRSAVYASRFLRTFFPVMLAVLLLTGTGLFAQERFGSIVGVVYDSSKAVLPGAEVTIINLETKRETKLTTRDNGRFEARELVPGHYSVSAEKSGFAKSEYPDIILLLGKTFNLDFTLQVGQVKETIVVSGSVTMIDTNTTTVTHNVTSDEFDAMPKGRSFQDVALTAPSVQSGDIEGGIQVNGASGAENQYTIDGLSTTSMIDGTSRQNATFEYLQEVQVKTSGIEAEYGGALGGVISAVTKSGGNAFHGEFHWYNYGSPFNAAPNLRLQVDTNDNTTTKFIQDPKDSNHINEFGGSVGGYIIKDKLYFYTAYSPSVGWRTRTLEFADGPDTYKSTGNYQNLFNKISWDATKRIRTNFSWLYQTQKQSGLIPRYNGMTPGTNDFSTNDYSSDHNQGWIIPQNNYRATVDITLSNTSLLSLQAGYFWDNYKDLNAPSTPRVFYVYSNVGMEGIPEDLQHGQNWSNVPGGDVSIWDITSRAVFQADFSKTFHGLGTHTFKAGAGIQKSVNNSNVSVQGGYQVGIAWGASVTSPIDGVARTGVYGNYRYEIRGTMGSAGSTIDNLYIQDQWRIHPRLTLSLGLRTEKENIPSFRPDIQKYAMQFGWGDKLAPRLGASFDVLGNGKWKVFGSWGRFYDWTKYTLVRGSFGGDTWKRYYHALDTLDIFSLGSTGPENLPGLNLWNPNDPNAFRDLRIPSFGADKIDPNIKPMRQTTMVIGSEYQLNPTTVVGVNWVHARLNRTIEDIGLINTETGATDYPLGNPGEGRFKMETNHISDTPDFPMPKPKREYDAVQITFNRRFAQNWFLGANYTWSRLFGNYPGLSDTDEIAVTGWVTDQQSAGNVARPGTNTTTLYDSEAYLLDSHGRYLNGRLATDRPHTFKAYGSYQFKFGTAVSVDYFITSGTPLSTILEDIYWDQMIINGRGDLGRTPTLSQTNLMVSHEFKIKESKTLRFEFNMSNLFNQKTVRYTDPLVNRFREESAEVDLTHVNLLDGFDWQQLFAQTDFAQSSPDPYSFDPLQNAAVNPTYLKPRIWNTGFQGRFGVKFVF